MALVYVGVPVCGCYCIYKFNKQNESVCLTVGYRPSSRYVVIRLSYHIVLQMIAVALDRLGD